MGCMNAKSGEAKKLGPEDGRTEKGEPSASELLVVADDLLKASQSAFDKAKKIGESVVMAKLKVRLDDFLKKTADHKYGRFINLEEVQKVAKGFALSSLDPKATLALARTLLQAMSTALSNSSKGEKGSVLKDLGQSALLVGGLQKQVEGAMAKLKMMKDVPPASYMATVAKKIMETDLKSKDSCDVFRGCMNGLEFLVACFEQLKKQSADKVAV